MAVRYSTEMRCDHVEKSNGISKKSNDTTIMIDAGYNYDRLAEKMNWLGIDPHSIRHILITYQDTDHVGAVCRNCRLSESERT